MHKQVHDDFTITVNYIKIIKNMSLFLTLYRNFSLQYRFFLNYTHVINCISKYMKMYQKKFKYIKPQTYKTESLIDRVWSCIRRYTFFILFMNR